MSSPWLAAGQKPYTPRAVSSFSAMMRSSSSFASSNNLRAASPCCGSSNMRGYLPFSSHVIKNGDQSMYSRSVLSGTFSSTRGPVNSGFGISTLAQSVLKRCASASAYGTSFTSCRFSCEATSCFCSSRFSISSFGRASGLISFSTTPTERDASSTWTTSEEYVGRDFYGRVLCASGRPADQQRQLEVRCVSSRGRRGPFHRGSA